LFGAAILGLIAVLPFTIRFFTDKPGLAIGGTALLIVVAVVIDVIKRLDAQIAVREY